MAKPGYMNLILDIPVEANNKLKKISENFYMSRNDYLVQIMIREITRYRDGIGTLIVPTLDASTLNEINKGGFITLNFEIPRNLANELERIAQKQYVSRNTYIVFLVITEILKADAGNATKIAETTPIKIEAETLKEEVHSEINLMQTSFKVSD